MHLNDLLLIGLTLALGTGCARVFDDIGQQINYLEGSEFSLSDDGVSTPSATSARDLESTAIPPSEYPWTIKKWRDPPQARAPKALFKAARKATDPPPEQGVLICRLHLTRTEAWDLLSPPDLSADLRVKRATFNIDPDYERHDPNMNRSWFDKATRDLSHRYTTYVSVPGMTLGPGDSIGVTLFDRDWVSMGGKLGSLRPVEVADASLTFDGKWPVHIETDQADIRCQLLPPAMIETRAARSLARADLLIAQLAAEPFGLKQVQKTPSLAEERAWLGLTDSASLLGWADPRIQRRVTCDLPLALTFQENQLGHAGDNQPEDALWRPCP